MTRPQRFPALPPPPRVPPPPPLNALHDVADSSQDNSSEYTSEPPFRFARYRPDTKCKAHKFSGIDLRKTYYLTIKGMVQGVETKIFIDTGSAITCINENLWNTISTTTPLTIENSRFIEVQTASGENVAVLGASDINFTVGNFVYTFKTHVVPKLHYAAIIGKDFLQHNDCVIDFKSGYLKVSRDNIVPFLSNYDKANAHESLSSAFNNAMPFPPESTQMPPISSICVHAAETCEIPANSACVIPATFRENGLAEATGLIEPNERLAARYNICGASALVTVSASGLVPFRVH